MTFIDILFYKKNFINEFADGGTIAQSHMIYNMENLHYMVLICGDDRHICFELIAFVV